MSKKIKRIIILGIAIIIIAPFIINLTLPLFSSTLFDSGTNGEWLGFWGGYLGALIAIPLSIFSVYIAYMLDNKKRRDNWRINVFDNMNEATIDYSLKIQSSTVRFKSSIEENPDKMLSSVINQVILSCEEVIVSGYVEYLSSVYKQVYKLPETEQHFLDDEIAELEEALQVDATGELIKIKKEFKNNEFVAVPIETINKLIDLLTILDKSTDTLDKIAEITGQKRYESLK